jgi:twitching motility protein PilT
LVDSLLTAIVRADGDALVLHVGEKPYVVAGSEIVELSSRALTMEALVSMIAEILPEAGRQALADLGAVEHQLPVTPAVPGQRFTVVAARNGEDIWVEIRRPRETARQATTPGGAASAPRPEPGSDAAPVAPEPARATTSSTPAFSPAPDTERPTPVTRETEHVTTSKGGPTLPPARDSVRPDPTTRGFGATRLAGLDRLLRLAAARGATTLYIVANTRPSVRVDGEIEVLEEEPMLDASQVGSLILDLAPERNREALRSGVGTEWIVDVAEVGRVRCMSFRDHRGPGGIFRMIPARAISAEQLGLSREIQALCAEREGLILIAGPRSSGKSTLLSALVDLINRTRTDHVITLESEIKFVQESRSSLVSQREVRGDAEEMLAVGRAALRENPDVLVIEDLRSAEIMALALEAAESGRLVIGALTAHTAAAAIGRVIDQTPAERRSQTQLTLAETLLGVVAQVLLRKSGGGRVAAREVLLNTPSVANLIAEGRIQQIPLALDSGRRHGMVPLNDALVAFVRSGAVDAREAYRKASDRPALLALLRREGIDTSFVERLG